MMGGAGPCGLATLKKSLLQAVASVTATPLAAGLSAPFNSLPNDVVAVEGPIVHRQDSQPSYCNGIQLPEKAGASKVRLLCNPSSIHQRIW